MALEPNNSSNLEFACRLCLGISSNLKDLSDVFDPDRGYDKKISIYLYLRVAEDDQLSRKVCWQCSSHLDNFHMFHEKIRETQLNHLGQKFREFELKPIYTVDIVDDIAAGGEVLIKAATPDYVEEAAHPTDDTSEVAAADEDEINSQSVKEVEKQDYEVVMEASAPEKPLTSTSTMTLRKRRKKSTFNQSPEISGSEEPPIIVKKKKADDDNDNDDFPPPLDFEKGGFPKTIIKDGAIQVKGKKLQKLVAQFFSLKCEICTKTSTTFQGLMDHFRQTHKQDGFVGCCGSKMKTYRSAVLHMAKHIQPDAFKCSVCGYIVTRPSFLMNHMLTHVSAEEKPFACPDCPKRFVWKNAFEIHVATHKPPEERRVYLCHVCSKQYDTPGGLSTHKRLAHSGEKREKILCHICSKEFSTRAGLNEHTDTIHQEQREKNQLQCHECGKWLMNKRCLKTHMLLHSGKDLRCELCDYVTRKRTLLNRHKVTHHSADKPFACTQCDKTFKLRRALTVHIQVSHAEVPKIFKCDFCDKTFGSSTNYYSHRKNIHPEQLKLLQEKQAHEKRLKRIEAGLEAPAVIEISSEQCELNDGNTQTFIIQLQ